MLLKYYIGVGLRALLRVRHAVSDSKNFDPNPVFLRRTEAPPMGSAVPRSRLFSLLPERKPPWIEFTFSTGTQALVIALFVWVRVLHPEVLSTPEHDYRVVTLVSTPAPVNHQPQPLPLQKPIVAARAEFRPDVLHVPAAGRKHGVEECHDTKVHNTTQ